MLTIREIKARTETFFLLKGVPNAKLDTDTLIAHSLGLKRLDLYLDLDRPLTEAQLDALRPLVRRRADREPLQYIVGSTEFYGLTLKVDARALIPRQETEELVDQIVSRLKTTPRRILDLGTGSGALALALASVYPEASIVATDQSAEALALATENAASLRMNERITFLQGSWWEALSASTSFDLIVSNPPYLTDAERETAEPEVVVHEPSSALFAGSDGLDDLKILLGAAPQYLEAGGLLALETGITQADALTALARQAGLDAESLEDLSGRPRFFMAKRR